jgi:ElaB/YqjD/DUF883 family membrane-anchored ribosome-binding protein
MIKNKHVIRNGIGNLVDDARALMDATAGVAGDRVGEARERLAEALESVKEMAGNVRDKAVEGVNATDEAVREHPYQALGIAAVAGGIIGFLIGRRFD